MSCCAFFYTENVIAGKAFLCGENSGFVCVRVVGESCKKLFHGFGENENQIL
jgi:hypothetical protein